MCNENLLRRRFKSSVSCIMHFGNAPPDMNYGMPVAERGREKAYFRARQKNQNHITYSEFQTEAEDYNLSGCFTNSGTKCFLFAKSLSRVQRRIRRANAGGLPPFFSDPHLRSDRGFENPKRLPSGRSRFHNLAHAKVRPTIFQKKSSPQQKCKSRDVMGAPLYFQATQNH